MKAILLAALAAMTLVGCSVDRVAGQVGGVDVEASRDGEGKHKDHGDSDGGFCPPGQAKKGNC